MFFLAPEDDLLPVQDEYFLLAEKEDRLLVLEEQSQPGLPAGVLTVSERGCVHLTRPSGSPNGRRPVAPGWARWFPGHDTHNIHYK